MPCILCGNSRTERWMEKAGYTIVRCAACGLGWVDPPPAPDVLAQEYQSFYAGFFPTKGAEPKQAGLPELDGCTRVRAARPGASVLATCSVDGTDMPVLAIQPVEKGRSAVFTGDTTRKWQQGPRALDQETPFLRFWGQMVRWAAGRTGPVEAAAGITASTDKGYY